MTNHLKDINDSNISSIKFQAIDWRFNHINNRTIFCDSHKNRQINNNIKEFIVQIFGKTENNENIYVEVEGFQPCFYILYSHEYKIHLKDIKKFQSYLNVIISKPMKLINFYGFRGNEQELFVKVSSSNFFSLKNFGKECLEKDYLKTFELNKDPIVQFIHEKKLKTCGWIEIKNGKYKEIEDDSGIESSQNEPLTAAQINIRANWNNINYLNNYDDKIQKFVIAAMDIECVSEDGGFPQATRAGDKIVSIATTFSRIGESECFYKNIIVLEIRKQLKDNKIYISRCPKIIGAEVINCKTESELILQWCNIIREKDPDIMTNWNGFGFDDLYIKERAKLLGIEEQIKLSRIHNEQTKFVEKQLASSALGENILKYYDMRGRVNFDLMKLVQRDHKLSSYKLDYVASYFFRERIAQIIHDNNATILTIKTKEFSKDQYVIIIHNDGVTDYEYEDNRKFKIIEIIDESHLKLDGLINPNLLKEKGKILCCNVKDDIKPQEIFRKYKNGTSKDLKELSQYNIQDCNLCNKLVNKLCVIINNMGMANVCYIPLNWIFNRGQSPKVYSIVSKKCKEDGYLIPSLKKKETDIEITNKITFEGAYVLSPKPGLYDCIFTLDFAALYPNSIICKNISHETYVMDKEYMNKYKDQYDFIKVQYKQIDSEDVSTHSKKTKSITNSSLANFMDIEERDKINICYFAKDKTKLGLIPTILTDLLKKRADVRKQQKTEKDQFRYQVLDGLQLAYKVTCNSVYGQLGCSENIGPISLMDLAACTTATGREMLMFAKYFAEELYPKIIDETLKGRKTFGKFMHSILKEYDKIHGINEKMQDKENRQKFYDMICNVIKNTMDGLTYEIKVIYGDTDSIMVHMNLKRNNILLTGLEMRQKYIQMGDLASNIIAEILPKPERLEYEKILSPFLILSKKRYVGNLYERNANELKEQKNMGIVLKRRDNAHIVKYVVGGVVDRLLNTPTIIEGKELALTFAEKSLKDIISGKFNINMFIVSKTLKKEYKNRKSIGHAILADRITMRDPGNAPASNDRIPFVYIVTKNKVKLQGDKIEHPEYVKANNLQIDYDMYITNQIKEPCTQFLNLFDKERTEQIFNNIHAEYTSCILDFLGNQEECNKKSSETNLLFTVTV